MSRSALAAQALVAAILLGGCGQKGPLYLPDSGGEVITRPMSTDAAPTPAGEPVPTPPQRRSPPPAQTPAAPPAS